MMVTFNTYILYSIFAIVSNAFFVAPLYEGDEGETEKICVNLTKPIAKQTTIAINRSPVSGSDGTEGNII